MKYNYLCLTVFCLVVCGDIYSQVALPGSVAPNETTTNRETDRFFSSFERDTLPNGVVLIYDEPLSITKGKPVKVLIYALPNGSTMAMGYGKQALADDPPVFESQHIGAQTRFIRQLDTLHTYVVVYVENELRSWPAWVRAHADARPEEQIAGVVRHIREKYRTWRPDLLLTCHSGGGRFIFSFLDSQSAIPEDVRQIVFLDANYGYEEEQHLSKFQKWLKDGRNQLQVIAYNDSVVIFQGKPLVSPTGGTWYRSKQMIRDLGLKEKRRDGILAYYSSETASDGSDDLSVDLSSPGNAEVILIDNPEGLIYHSVLVERNGFIHSLLRETNFHDPNWFWEKRVYDNLVLRNLPQRPDNARSGSEWAEIWTGMDQTGQPNGSEGSGNLREQQIAHEILSGNFPDFMRHLVRVDVQIPYTREKNQAGAHDTPGVLQASYWVMPDYLMVGDDDDFLRLPMTPNTAQLIADRMGFFLSTAKIADDVYQAATVKLEPQPLTEEREAFATFVHHHQLIEAQRQGRSGLIAGIKKDVISTPRLFETDRPDRVALYGWHKPDGLPIQPIYTGHVDHYVDYSHGFRLVWQYILIDGKYLHHTEVLSNPQLRQILTNEGNERHFNYPTTKD